MGDDDFAAGDEQGEEAEDGDPVGDADDGRVAGVRSLGGEAVAATKGA